MKSEATSADTERGVDPYIAFWILHLESRCEALQTYLVELYKKLDLSRDDRTHDRVKDLTRAILQQKLEGIEKQAPGFAAEIDRYRPESELPDEYL